MQTLLEASQQHDAEMAEQLERYGSVMIERRADGSCRIVPREEYEPRYVPE